jgi:predicted short-subunit dehydrogenase-like oxidoreductase (DUF2520 family)
MIERVVVVGPGRVGLALGYALAQSGAVRELVFYGRRPEPPSHPLFGQGLAGYHFGLAPIPPGTEAVILAVPDDTIHELAHALAAQGAAPPGCAALHCSGALSAEPLAPLHVRGFAVGSLHPLQSLAHALQGAEQLPGSAFAVSGEPGAVAVARRLVAALGGQVLQIPVARRAQYHAAAALASNGLAALVATAARLLVRTGLEADTALAALYPLMRGSLANLERMGLQQGLTGPVSRGDVETVRLHLATLEPRERSVYVALGLELTELAAEARDENYPAEALRTLFLEYR